MMLDELRVMNARQVTPFAAGLRRLFFIAVGCLVLVRGSVAAPVITEFMADNWSVMADEDGEFSDWIEITNPTPTAIALNGYQLTDAAATPAKWTFPALSLAAGERMLVFASGKDRRNTASPLHTNFALSKDGGYLALRDAGGNLLSEFANYPAQRENVSFGTRGTALILAGADCRWKVPRQEMSQWTLPGYSDRLWTPATSGIGYDTRAAPGFYHELIGNGSFEILRGQMASSLAPELLNGSVYVRFDFQVADPGSISQLTLKMRYDDGFVAWLNGVQVASANAPGNPAWNSTAPLSTNSTAWAEFPLAAHLGALLPGRNVLAIQGMNGVLTSNDLLILPELNADYGGGIAEGYFTKPTPGKENGSAFQNFAEMPLASKNRGFYAAPFSVTLTSSTPGATIRYTIDGSIPDMVNGMTASGPVSINSTTVLRAVAYKSSWSPSPTMTQTYVFPGAVKIQPAAPLGTSTTWGHAYDTQTGLLSSTEMIFADYEMSPDVTMDPDYSGEIESSLMSLPVVSLVTTQSDFLSDEGIYGDRRGNHGESSEIPVSMEYFAAGETNQIQLDAGLRVHGGNARLIHPKKPLRLYFRSDYGSRRMVFPLFPGGRNSFDQLVLRPGGHDGWAVPFGGEEEQLAAHATYIRDAFVRRTEEAAGLPQVRGKFVHLYLNGLYWGLYDLGERPSAAFFAQRDGGAEEDWDVLHHAESRAFESSTLDGNSASWKAIMIILEEQATDAAVAEVGRRVDLDAFCDHMIVRMWSGDYDWMSPVMRNGVDVGSFKNKNWYAAGRPRGDVLQPFRLMSWDAEMSMGQHLMSRITPTGQPLPAQRVDDFDLTQIDKYVLVEPGGSFLVQTPAGLYAWLKQNAGFRRKFSDHVYRHLFNGGILSPAVAKARLAKLRSEIESAIVAESARWGDVNGVSMKRNSHWRPEMDWLRDSFVDGEIKRSDRLVGQFRGQGLYPTDELNIVWSQRGGTVSHGSQITLQAPEGATIYYTTDGSDPLTSFQATNRSIVPRGAPAKLLVPSVANGGSQLFASWRGITNLANEAQWRSVTTGIGYEADPYQSTFSAQPGAYAPFIQSSVPEMFNVNPSVYLRIPFHLTAEDLSKINALSLRIRFDDGFIAWINGIQVASRNAYNMEPTWTSEASIGQEDAWAIAPWWFDATFGMGALMEGENMLAIQGLNGSVNSRDLLIDPELIAHSTAPGGEISPTAITYTAPVSITEPVQISVRVLSSLGDWSALDTAWFSTAAPASAQNLVVSEFSYRPSAAQDATELAASASRADFEFIEVMNVSNDPVDLRGIRFTEGIQCTVGSLAQSTILLPGKVALIVKNRAAFAARYGEATNDIIVAEFSGTDTLDNDSERITILASNGEVIQSFVYADRSPWPAAVDGEGFTLELIVPYETTDHGQASNWRASRDKQGSPGDIPLDYSTWASRWGEEPSINVATNDSDNDGISNFMEFALGTNPAMVETQSFMVVEILQVGENQFLAAHYATPPLRSNVTVSPQYSTDLQTWTTDHLLPIQSPGVSGFRTDQPIHLFDRGWFRFKAEATP